MIRSSINASGTRAQLFRNDAPFGEVRKHAGFWQLAEINGSTRNICPAVESKLSDPAPGYKPIAVETKIGMGVALNMIRRQAQQIAR